MGENVFIDAIKLSYMSLLDVCLTVYKPAWAGVNLDFLLFQIIYQVKYIENNEMFWVPIICSFALNW